MLTVLSYIRQLIFGVPRTSSNSKEQPLRAQEKDENGGIPPANQAPGIDRAGGRPNANPLEVDPKKELRNRPLAIMLIVLDAAVLASLLISDGALNWLGNVPFLGSVMKLATPFITVATLVQLAVILVFYTANVLLDQWGKMHETRGAPKPNAAVALLVTVSLLVPGIFFLPHEMPREQTASVLPANDKLPIQRPQPNPEIASSGPSSEDHVATIFRLRHQKRDSILPPQDFVVGPAVTDVELRTPIAYSKIARYSITLDKKEIQGYQIRNGELIVTVDRDLLQPGPHTLRIVTLNRTDHRQDPEDLIFNIVDSQ
jgi:hypothetical protein